jgi:hypothetical protein
VQNPKDGSGRAGRFLLTIRAAETIPLRRRADGPTIFVTKAWRCLHPAFERAGIAICAVIRTRIGRRHPQDSKTDNTCCDPDGGTGIPIPIIR